MADILRTGANNYFINQDGTISMQYDPYFNTCFMKYCGDAPKIKIGMDKISIQPGGQIVFRFNNRKYIIDDGYRNTLIMAGYLDLQGFNDEKDLIAFREQESSKKWLLGSFSNIDFDNSHFIYKDFDNIYLTKVISGYNIEVDIESINSMIDRNIQRSKANLPMYPTIRGFDKKSSLYFRIYAQKDATAKISKSKEELHSVCYKMIKDMLNRIYWKSIKALYSEDIGYLRYNLHECKIQKTIIKWEEEL